MFWHLNPKKLEPFFEAYQANVDIEYEKIRIASHQTGLYVRTAVASLFNKNVEYPSVPFGTESEENTSQQDSGAKPLTDAEKFEMWMIVHNEQLKRKRAKQKEAEAGKE